MKAFGARIILAGTILFSCARTVESQAKCLWDNGKPVIPEGSTWCRTRDDRSPAPNPVPPPPDPLRSVRFFNPVVEGEVYIDTPDGRRIAGAAIAGHYFDFGSKIVTGPSGSLRVTLPDGSAYTVGENAEMVIDEFIWDPDITVRKFTIGIVKGMFRWVTGKVDRQHYSGNVRINGTMASPRGTDVEFFSEPGGSAYIKVFEGEVTVTPFDSDVETEVHAGQTLNIDIDGKMALVDS
jgi:hypothetical protein